MSSQTMRVICILYCIYVMKIPLLLAWMRAGMSIGSALTFMIAGSAMKFTNLGAVKIILGAKNFMLYVLYCLGISFISGFVADSVFRVLAH